MASIDNRPAIQPSIDVLLLLIGSIAGLVVMATVFSGNRSFEEAALGSLTAVHEAQGPQGENTHCQRINEEDQTAFLEFVSKYASTILFLGNSQTHSINQKKEGEAVYPELIQKRLDSIAILTHSMPNANLQEFLVSHAWWTEQINPEMVVVPAFMDDLREDGLRGDFLKSIVSGGYQMETSHPLEVKLNEQLDFLTNPPSEAGSESKEQTPQDISEAALNDWLSEHTSVWRNRANARGDLFLGLYGFRNKLFGINASTQRKMIPARYDRNLKALDLLCTRAGENGQRVLVYIPPIRTDVAPPYDPEEYLNFKRDIESQAQRHDHVVFANLEDIVPGPLWGLKASTDGSGEPELDFMHFQFSGHEILANGLIPMLTP